MVNKTINVALDLKRVTPQSQTLPILVEGDNGNIFVVTLTDDGTPVDLSSCKVLAVFSKVSDGTTSEQDTEDAIVELSAYGLVLTGTPTTSDTITATVLAGVVVASTDVSGGSVTVDQDTFLSKIPDDGVYVFTYQSSGVWQLGANSVVISGANHNIITIDLKNSSFGVGKNVCEIQVYSGTNFETLVTTAQFNFDGRKGISNSDTIRRTGEYPVLSSLIIMAREALALAYPWANVTVTAVAGNAAGVNVTQDADSVELDFIIPNSVYVGDDPPTGDEEVWIIPGGEGGSQEGTVMTTEIYDQDNDGVVDNAEQLGGQLPSYYATASDLTAEIANRAAAITAAVPVATSTSPKMNGTASVGSETKWAKGDHIHPTDTTRAPLASPALSGTPTAPTAADNTNSTQIATTAWVRTRFTNSASNTTPKVNGNATAGTETAYARGDHVHPTDTGRAAAAITGTTTLASGDGLIFADASDSSKLKRSSITFDGATVSKALTQKGTWETFHSGTLPVGSGGTGATSAASALTNLGAAASSHAHGSITNAGAITGTTALANGDGLIFADNSDSSKLKRASITFDGSTTSKALTQKGTWGTFLTSHQSLFAPVETFDQASHTLESSHAGKLIKASRATAQTITVPANATKAIAVGTEIEIVRWGTGSVTISPAIGVTIYSKYPGRSIVNHYGGATLKKMDTNVWLLDGDLG